MSWIWIRVRGLVPQDMELRDLFFQQAEFAVGVVRIAAVGQQHLIGENGVQLWLGS